LTTFLSKARTDILAFPITDGLTTVTPKIAQLYFTKEKNTPKLPFLMQKEKLENKIN
jgi:hypothetical protein